jgi:GAF domain-containing protein
LIVGQTLVVSVLALMVAVGGLVAPESGLLALIPSGLIAVAVGIVAYWLLRRGHVERAGYVSLLGVSVAITSGVFVRGFQDVSGIYYLWPILVAVFLLGTWGGMAVTVVSASLYLGLAILQRLGIHTPPLPVEPQTGEVFVVTSRLLMFFLLAFLGRLVSQGLDTALQQSRQAAQRWREFSERLEQRVAERTQALEQRAVQLATAVDVGRAAASILDLELLVREVIELVQERFDLYYAGLFLLDDAAKYAVLEAGTGEAGRMMKEQGHRLVVGGESMVGLACEQHQVRVAQDVNEALKRFDNPLLPETRSEMALPLVVGDRVLGALDVQSTRPEAFSQEDMAVFQLLADQVAVAVDNAHKFSDAAEILEASSPLFRISRRLAEATTPEEVGQAVVMSIAETNAEGGAMACLDRSMGGEVEAITFLSSWNRRRSPRFPPHLSLPPSPAFPLSLATRRTILEDVEEDEGLPEETRQYLLARGVRALAVLPLRLGGGGPGARGDRVLGFIAIDRGTPGRFSAAALQVYETLSEQAAAALERARLLEESQEQAWREHLIRDISDRVTASFDLDTLLQETLQEVGRVVGAAGGYVELGSFDSASLPAESATVGGHPGIGGSRESG